ncbi:bifunctional 2-hydroxyacyl-CoA dehydratase/activator domain-containing protein [Clostridia bacterium]|nr:bifunctional 2-hydroxyacyl-CoA dehydratase/activator domain-containing protein [Clostridia bacterium]
MILYFCRYAPAEILEAMGAETEYLAEEGGDTAEAEALLHPASCSFTKAALGAILARAPEGVLFTSCCDSTRRLYDVVKRLYPDRFVFMLPLPVRQDETGLALYRQAVRDMIRAYADYAEGRGTEGQAFGSVGAQGRRPDSLSCCFDARRLAEIMRGVPRPCHEDEEDGGGQPRIGLVGAKIPPSLEEAVKAAGARVVFNASCSGQKNRFYLSPLRDDDEGILDAYIRGVFSKYPCMRMMAGDERAAGLKKMAADAKIGGLIYHTIKFCDNYAYEYADMLADRRTDGLSPRPADGRAAGSGRFPDIPVLKVETDYTASGAGQLATRICAFVEMICTGGRLYKETGRGEEMTTEKNRAALYALGIDSGSTSTNAVVLDPDGAVAGTATVPTGAKTRESAVLARRLALAAAGLPEDAEIATVATGYGRAGIAQGGEVVTEITCHARGAHRLYPAVRTIIDIGGQDSKAIRIDARGGVADFAMNDKCAAGTGRFLEKTAGALGVSLAEIGAAAWAAQTELQISSMCTVFAESEVVSLIADGHSREDILNGLCQAVARRNEALLKRVSAEPPYMMTGGVARNAGVVKAFEALLNAPVYVPDEPELAGALGAAIFAGEMRK